jgi:hypothetical protein
MSDRLISLCRDLREAAEKSGITETAIAERVAKIGEELDSIDQRAALSRETWLREQKRLRSDRDWRQERYWERFQ